MLQRCHSVQDDRFTFMGTPVCLTAVSLLLGTTPQFVQRVRHGFQLRIHGNRARPKQYGERAARVRFLKAWVANYIRERSFAIAGDQVVPLGGSNDYLYIMRQEPLQVSLCAVLVRARACARLCIPVPSPCSRRRSTNGSSSTCDVRMQGCLSRCESSRSSMV